MLYYENFDLQTVHTTINADKLENLLVHTGYPAAKTRFLVDGFRRGFSICYNGNAKVRKFSPNLKFTIGDPIVLWNKVMKEVKLRRFAGPYSEVPFDYFIQSPIGLVPKDDGKNTRLIFHLSYPRTDSSSVNRNRPPEKCKVKYADFDQAIQLCLESLESGKCFVAKSDFSSAFRNVGLESSS